MEEYYKSDMILEDQITTLFGVLQMMTVKCHPKAHVSKVSRVVLLVGGKNFKRQGLMEGL